MKIIQFKDTMNIILVNAVASFPNVVKPRLNTADPKPENHFLEYTIELLIPKDTDMTELNRVMDLAKTERWGEKIPQFRYAPIKDGDNKFNRDGEPYDGYPGNWFIVAKADENRKPSVIDHENNDLTRSDAIVGGDIVNVFCSVYAYGVAGNNGIGFGLNSIQLVRKAEQPLGGGVSREAAKAAFASVEGLDDFSV